MVIVATGAVHPEAFAWRSALSMGQTAYNCCDYPSARALFEQSLAVSRELGDQRGIAASLNNVATVACEQADISSARTLQQQALMLRRELGDLLGVASSLDGLAYIASAARPDAAARFWGAGERLREEIGSPLPPSDRSRHDCSVSAARVTVGHDVFDTAWREGRAMSLEQALQYALDDQDGYAPISRP